MLGGKVLWKRIHEPYPASLYFKSSGLLYLNFDPYYYVYAYDGNSWVLRKDLSHRSALKLDPSMYPKDITILTEKIVGESVKLVENDTDLYRVYDHGNGIFLYVFDTNSRCVEVKYRGHTVTKRQSRGPYPRRIVFYSESLTFEFDFESRSTIYRLYDAGWYISDDSNKLEHIEYQPPDWILKHSYYKFGSKLSLSKLTIMTSDNKDGSGAKPIYLKSSMFHCNKWISGYFYPVNGLYLELGYKGLVFFKSTDYPYRGNPRVVLFDLDNHNICVFFDTGFKVSFNHIDDSDKETVLQAERMPRTGTKHETDSDSETETTPVPKTVITPAKATPAGGTKPFTRSVVRTPKEPVKTKSPESKLVSAPVTKELPKTPETKPPVITILPKPIRPKSFTNVTVDIEKKQSTNAFNYYKNDNFRTYVPKPGYVFSKVTERTEVIWKSTDVFATFVTTKRKNFLVILLQSGNIVLFHKSNAEQPWEDITNKRYDVTKFKFLGESDAEISTSDYKVTLVKTVVEFTLKDGVDCKKIKYGNQVIWEYNDTSFKQFELGLVSNEFHPLYSSAYRRKLDYKVPKLPPETEPTKTTEPKPASAPVSSVTTTETKATPTTAVPLAAAPEVKPIIPPTPEVSGEAVTPAKAATVATPAKAPDAKVTTPPSSTPSVTTPAKAPVTTPKAAPKTEVVKSTDPVPSKVSVSVEAPTGRPRPKRAPEAATGLRTAVPVNITVKESSSTVDFSEDYLKNVKIYSAKPKYAFNQIVISCCSGCCKCEKVIWTAKDQNEYFDRVFVDGLGTCATTRNFSIHLCNGSFKHFGKERCGGGWSEYPSIIDLDLKTKDSNIQLDLIEKDNCRTYVAKPGYKIKNIKKGNEHIWASQTNQAIKVVLLGSKKKPKHLSILLETGEGVFLYKGGKGDSWQNITSSRHRIADLKMYTLVDGNKHMKLHAGHYSVTLFGSFYGYLFYDWVDCVKVAHRDNSLWERDAKSEFGNVKGIFLDVTSNKFSVMSDDDEFFVCEEVKKMNPVILDIGKKASTENYDFTVDHHRNILIYTAKGSSMFYQVVKRGGSNCCGSACCGSETIIWETNDPNKYASKVFTDGMGACESPENVSIHLMNGQIEHYNSSKKGWQKASNKVCLYIKKTSSNIFYDFVQDGETRTFTPKPGYLFNKVVLKSSWTWVVCGSSCCKSGCLSDEVFLDSQKDDQCSTKVVLYGAESSIKNINIFLKNGSIVHFHKIGKKWFSKTPIVVDIDINKDNDLFEYRPTRTFGHFNPKANLTIEKIVKKNRDIWKAQKDHGLKVVLMGSGKEEKHLSILLQSGNFVLLQKSGKGESWENITDKRSNFSGIKLFSLDEGTSKYRELTREDYDPTVFESRYGYEFKDGVKCAKITNNDKIVWTHTDDMEFGYPKGLYLDLRQNTFSITNLKDRTKELAKGEVRKVSSFIKISLDIEKTHLGDKIDYSKIGTVYTFVPNTGHAFSKISLGNTSIWQCKDVCGILVKTKTKENKKYVAILLEDYSFSLFEQSDGKTWNDVTDKRYDVTALRFYGDSDKLLTYSDHKATIVNYSYEFKFNDGVTCKKIKYGDDVVWRHTDDPNYSTIKMFHLGLISNTFFVLNSKSQAKKLDYRGPITPKVTQTRVTPAVISPAKPEPAVKPEIISPQVSKVTRVISVSDTERPDFIDPKYNLLQTSGDPAPDKVKLYSNKSGGSVCKVEKYFDDLDYNLEGLQCEFITHGGNCVWKHEDGKEYPDSMTLKDDDTIIVTFHKVYHICYMENNEWKSEIRPRDGKGPIRTGPSYKLGRAPGTTVTKEPDKVKEPEPTKAEEPDKLPEPAKTTPVTLDIEKTQPTNEFQYAKEDDCHTYTVKSGNVFSKVTKGTTDIWDAKDNICGTKVIFIDDEDGKFLAVLLSNNMFNLIHLDNNTWTDITSKKHDVKKLKFLGESDKELTSSDYSATIADYSYRFMFNDESSCKKIKYEDEVIWKSTEAPKAVMVLELGLISNKFYVLKSESQFKEIELKGTTTSVTPEKAAPTTAPTDPLSQAIVTPANVPAQPKEAPVTAAVTSPVTATPKATEVTTSTTPQPSSTQPKGPETKTTTPPTISTASPVATPKVAPSGTPVALDISKTQSTNEFEYSKKSNYHTYTPKSGSVVSRVTHGTTDIWESKDGVFGTLVKRKKDELFVVLLQNRDFVLFQKTKKQPWTDITSQRHNVTALKFLGDNDSELKSTDYLVTVFDFSYRVTFKDGVDCKKIKYGDDEIWKYTNKACKHFELGLVSNKFFVCKNESSQKNLNFKGAIITRKAKPAAAPQVQPPVTPVATPKAAPPSGTPVTLDIDKKQSTTEFDYKKDGSDFHLYTPKSGHSFTKVTEKENVIWESKDAIPGTLVRKKKDEFVAILLGNRDFVLFNKDKNTNTWKDITSQRHNVSELKFLTDNDKEIASSDYTRSIVHEYSYEFKFNTGVKCLSIKYGNNVIWKHTDDNKYKDITKFQLGLVSNNFFVFKNENTFKNIKYKGATIPRKAQATATTQPKEAPATTPATTTATTAPESQRTTAKGQQEPKAQDTDQEEAKSTTPQVQAAPTGTTTPTAKVSEGEDIPKETAPTTPSLDVSSYTRLKTSGETLPDKVKLYSKKTGELVCAVTKDDDDFEYELENLECEAITHDDKCVWKRKDGQGYPLKMIYNGDDIITINFDGSYVLCTMFNNEWHLEERKSASTGSAPAPATTPAKAPAATAQPQPKSTPATAPTISPSPAKVTTTPPETKAATATAPASQVSGTEVTPSKAAPATTQPKAAPGTTPATPSATTQPSSTETKAPETKATPPTADESTTTVATPSSAEATPAVATPKAAPTTAPTVSTAPAKATVTKPIESKQPEVKLPLTPLNPVTLDMDKTQATNVLDYAKDIKINTYTPESGCGFNEIVLDKTVIWKSRDKICATLVVLRTSVAGKHLAILLNNNLFELLQQSDKDKPWEDITSTRADVTKLKFYDDGDDEITSSNYKVTILHYSYRYTYEFNDGVNCMKVKYDGLDIWSCSDDKKFGGPIKIFDLGLITNNFFVKNLSQYKKSKCDSTNQIPLTESIVPLKASSKKKTDVPSLPKVAVTVQVPVGRPRPKRVAGVGVKCTGTAVPVNIGVKSSTDTVDYNGDSLKNVKIYTPKVNYVFNQVVMGTSGSNCFGKGSSGSEKDIWTARDESEYFYRVYVDGLGACTNTSNFSIHLCNGTFRHFNNPGHGNWREVFSVIDFDMSTSSSNIEVDFIKKDKYRTYVPKPGYKIRTIVKGDIRIWECKNNDYALKAVLMGSENNPKHLAVLPQSGNASLLFKSKKGEKWQDITTTENSIANLKMYTLVENELEELNPKQYSVTLFGSFHGYVFYEGVDCVKIMHSDKTLWEHKDKNTSGNLKGIFLDLISHKFSVMNDDDSFKQC